MNISVCDGDIAGTLRNNFNQNTQLLDSVEDL